MGAEQLLKIDPEHELKFKGPFNVANTSYLRLDNPTDQKICFKIKTTAPKRYCVRPNAGVIESGGHLNIAVVLQPCEVDSSVNKHKFMVQAIVAPDVEAINPDELWKNIHPSNVMETKLRCNFEVPSDATNSHEPIIVTEEKVVRSAKHDVETTAKPQRANEDYNGEERKLQLENMQLKEECDRLRRKFKARMEEQAGYERQSLQASPQSQFMLFVVLGIVCAIAGLVAGKFFV